MNDVATPDKNKSLKTVTQVIYACYIASLVIGITGIIGLIIAYIKKPEAEGTIYASHMQYQIRTFWLTLLAAVIGVLLSFIGIGVLVLIAACIWWIFRTVKGWLRVNDGLPIEDPKGWL